MKLIESVELPIPINSVWEYLNDVNTLKNSIPGCEDLIKENDTKLNAKVKLKIGPVSTNFSGVVELSDLNPPFSYKISGTGNAGVAGSATGEAFVELSEKDNNKSTIMKYSVNASVNGKLAQLGSRLIESTAKKLAKKFFDEFVKLVNSEQNIK